MGGHGFRAEFNLTYINMGDRLCAHLKDGDVCSRPSMLYKSLQSCGQGAVCSIILSFCLIGSIGETENWVLYLVLEATVYCRKKLLMLLKLLHPCPPPSLLGPYPRADQCRNFSHQRICSLLSSKNSNCSSVGDTVHLKLLFLLRSLCSDNDYTYFQLNIYNWKHIWKEVFWQIRVVVLLLSSLSLKHEHDNLNSWQLWVVYTVYIFA